MFIPKLSQRNVKKRSWIPIKNIHKRNNTFNKLFIWLFIETVLYSSLDLELCTMQPQNFEKVVNSCIYD